MLQPADRDLVQRDPALPALRLLLDEEALADWLGGQLRTDMYGARVRVRGHYLRYKPGTSCVLAAHVDVGASSQPALFSAHAHHTFVKLTKTLERAPAGSVLGADPARGLLAGTPVADRDLRALALLADDSRRGHLLHRLLPDRPGLTDAAVQTLRHKPHRRWVGVLRPTAGAPVVLRLYPRGGVHAAAHAVAAWHDRGPRTPRLLGVYAHRGVTAVEYLPGEALPRRDASREGDDFAAAGAALARLHSCRGVPLRATGPGGEVRAVRAAARDVALLLPDVARDVRGLAETLSTRLLAQPWVGCAVHGDFSPDQVVVDDDGRAALIDLDASRLGDAAVDLACARAAVTRDVVLGRATADAAERRTRSLYDGYAAEGPLPEEQRLRTHEAAHLLRLAVEPFRLRAEPDWAATTRDLVARARRALETPTPAGGAR